ncbi:SIR2 family protein [Thiolapillus sp.]|uniref:SIR2 family protein n=1 Tax=Thiolapillus sp. TaxID=2017437 RepID=UPI0025CC5772|nr:SIR2 family protein [Thiolapillus sp.]
MSLSLSQLFPGIETGLNRIGFLFGAGTSKEAGYPLMGDLTKMVVSNLNTTLKATLDEILAAKSLTYNAASGTPNIEILSDLVTEYFVTTQDSKYGNLESEIRKLIVEAILSVTSPDITHHVRFLEALKRRAHGTSTIVTILTTNYDVLFELAAGEVGVRVETGFDGPLKRQFDPAVFDLARGTIENTRFTNRSELHVNIIKLHGSVSWFKQGSRVFESGLDLASTTLERALVLPRRRKVMDTLSEPFDQIFTRASRTLGSSCQFVVACGFSFGDKHINDQLIFPKLSAGKIRLTALCGEEPDCIGELKSFPPFHAGFPTNCFIDQKDTGAATDLWKFSALAQLLEP